ncbi:hypothetical protein ISS30_11445 [bacterium]|nr:hypothetical protein [bacterium]
MKRILFLSVCFACLSLQSFGEISAGLSVGLHKDIDYSSTGIDLLVISDKFSRSKFSLGYDLGLELVERHLHDTSPLYNDIVEFTYPDFTEIDSVAYFNKNYHEYIFFPIGFVFRYDPMLSKMETNPSGFYYSLFLEIGGSLAIRQTSVKQTQFWYDTPGDDNSFYGSYIVDGQGNESIAKFDWIVKPKVMLFWQRAYFSYEFYLFSEYYAHSFGVGYVFKL